MNVRENIKFQIEIKNRFQILKINKTNMEKYAQQSATYNYRRDNRGNNWK